MHYFQYPNSFSKKFSELNRHKERLMDAEVCANYGLVVSLVSCFCLHKSEVIKYGASNEAKTFRLKSIPTIYEVQLHIQSNVYTRIEIKLIHFKILTMF